MKKLVCGVAAAVAVLVTGASGVAGQTAMSVSRTAVCAGVDNREPTGVADVFTASVERVFFFSELTGVDTRQEVRHRWSYQGRTMAEVTLSAQGKRFRTWSSKKILPEWTGNWQVEVLDAGGAVLATGAFVVR